MPRDTVISQLSKAHEEAAIARGLSMNGKFMIELFKGPKGTWTIVTTDVTGRTCVVASGQSWVNLNEFPWLNQGEPS